MTKINKFPTDHHVQLAIAERRSYKHVGRRERSLLDRALLGVGGFERLHRVENTLRRDTLNYSEHVDRLRLSLPPRC